MQVCRAAGCGVHLEVWGSSQRGGKEVERDTAGASAGTKRMGQLCWTAAAAPAAKVHTAHCHC